MEREISGSQGKISGLQGEISHLEKENMQLEVTKGLFDLDKADLEVRMSFCIAQHLYLGDVVNPVI